MSEDIMPKQRSAGGSENGSETDEDQYCDKPGRIFESKTEPGICGLTNMGNTCFMNSALQCLANIPQLVEFFISGQYHAQINKNNKKTKGGAVAKEFGKLIQQMWCAEDPRIAPINFRSAITELAPDFKGYHQHDAQEFTMFLLDGLHDDLNRAKKVQSLPNPELGLEAPMSQYKSDNDSIITDLMHGQLKSTLVCTNCKNESVTFDPFCYLSLPLPSPPKENKGCFSDYGHQESEERQKVSIAECLRNFTEPEQIEKNCSCGWKFCERTLNIWRLPEILVVHLKRYQFVGTSMLKIGTMVNFAVKKFKLEDAIANSDEKHQHYELIAAVYHSGSLTYGHYRAFVLKSRWHSISDSTITPLQDVDYPDASSDEVYMLYYRKIASPAQSAQSLRYAGSDGMSSGTDENKMMSEDSDNEEHKN